MLAILAGLLCVAWWQGEFSTRRDAALDRAEAILRERVPAVSRADPVERRMAWQGETARGYPVYVMRLRYAEETADGGRRRACRSIAFLQDGELSLRLVGQPVRQPDPPGCDIPPEAQAKRLLEWAASRGY